MAAIVTYFTSPKTKNISPIPLLTQRIHTFSFAIGLLMLLVACGQPKPKPIDWNVGLGQKGKKPYDTYIAHKLLPAYFPDASISTLYSNYDFNNINRASYDSQEGHSLLVLIGKTIIFSKDEWAQLMQYMRNGNEIVMASASYDGYLEKDFHVRVSSEGFAAPLSRYNTGSDNVAALSLARYPMQRFGMHGRSLHSHFIFPALADTLQDTYDFTVAQLPTILGYVHSANDTLGKPNMVQYSVGAGHLTLLASPMMLTNYFLLQPGNRLYYDNIWQVVDGDIFQVFWGNFTHRSPNQSAWAVLMRHPATRWAVLLLLLLSVSFVIFQFRRQQRIIPIIRPNENSSLEFVNTVAMLYYNKGDNHNLACKMDNHFMEYLRSHFLIDTHTLDQQFILRLSRKSGISEASTASLIALIHHIRLGSTVSDTELLLLYQGIQQFYKKP
ncbi:MAG: hypothetical protein IT256_07270 [Chitinophagaceae bacterium]|nr:hypothetical protein [Chitinophagaceae bacterium]